MNSSPEKLQQVAKRLINKFNIYFFILITVIVFGSTVFVLVYYHKTKTSYLVQSIANGLDESIKQNDSYAMDQIIGPLISNQTISYFQLMLGETVLASSDSIFNEIYKKNFEIEKYQTLIVDRVLLTVDGEAFSVYIGYYVKHIHILGGLLALLGYIGLINFLMKRSFTRLTQIITGPLIEFTHDLTNAHQSSTEKKSYNIFEIDQLKKVFDKLLSDTKRINTLIAQDKIIKQVIHDIKAPLAALKTISQSNQRIEDDILKSSINRINQISNELFQKQTHQELGLITHFGLALRDIVNEKIVLLATRHLSINMDIEGVRYCWGKINTTHFQRAISNLIDNAIDALQLKKQGGAIDISALKKGHVIEIVIQDNGQGIPQNILEQLKMKGFSYKKQGGSGLGLESSRKIVDKYGGSLELSSVEGRGTTIVTTWPTDRPPDWLCETLFIPENPKICIIDDVLSIHQVWKQKFQQNMASFQLESLFAFQDRVPESDLYIVDYEFENSPINGLDFIQKKALKNAYLCTSHYEEQDIQRKCRHQGIKIIPKDFISNVSFETVSRQNPPIVHLDDDPLMRIVWKKEAKRQHVEIKSFSNSGDLKKNLKEIDKKTPFYIDQNLGEDTNGLTIAKELFEKGFSNIFISSGYEREEFQHVSFIKKAIGKSPPRNLIPLK